MGAPGPEASHLGGKEADLRTDMASSTPRNPKRKGMKVRGRAEGWHRVEQSCGGTIQGTHGAPPLTRFSSVSVRSDLAIAALVFSFLFTLYFL